MRLTEILVDSLMRTRIYELAYVKHKIINYAEDSVDDVLINLIKLLIFDSPQNYNHWIQVVDSPFLKLSRRKCKDTNKPLNYDTLRQIFFEAPLGHTDSAQEWMNDAHNETKQDRHKYHKIAIKEKTPQQVHNELESIIHEICLAVSNEKFQSVRTIISDYL